MTATEAQTGAVETPKQIKWITEKEDEKFSAMLDKRFVRLGPDGKPDSSAKEHFFRVIGINPYKPAEKEGVDLGTTDDFLLSFRVQKYHRFKKVKVTTRIESGGNAEPEAKNVEVNEPVAKWEMVTEGRAQGTWKVVNADAQFTMDARDFEKRFSHEKE